MDYIESFSGRLRFARQQRNLSMRGLAQAAGCTATHVCDLENEVSQNPTVTLVENLAKALRVRVTWLVGWSNDPSWEAADLANIGAGCAA